MSNDALSWDHDSNGSTEPEKLKEAGIYDFEITSIKRDRYDEGNPPCNTLELTVIVQGKKIWDTYYATINNEHKINRMLKSLGVWSDGATYADMIDKIVGTKGKCRIYLHTSNKLDSNGNPYINERIKEYKVESQAGTQPPAETLDTDW
jgi:hypothetical protein